MQIGCLLDARNGWVPNSTGVKGEASAAPIDAPGMRRAAPTLIGHQLRDMAGK